MSSLAFFSAKAGIEEARDRMRTGATGTTQNGLPSYYPSGNHRQRPLHPQSGKRGNRGSLERQHQHFLSRRRNLQRDLHDYLHKQSSKPDYLQYLVRSTTANTAYAVRLSSPGSGCALCSNRIMPFRLTPPMAAAVPARRFAGTAPTKRPPVVRRQIFACLSSDCSGGYP